MSTNTKYKDGMENLGFSSYSEYCDYLFNAINVCLGSYLNRLKHVFVGKDGNTKNVLYPDMESAVNICEMLISEFNDTYSAQNSDINNEIDTDLLDLFAELNTESAPLLGDSGVETSIDEMLNYVISRAEKTEFKLPFHGLYKKLKLTNFSLFTFTVAVLSSSQTNYANIFQIINQNGSMPAPTIEAAARVFYGKDFSMTAAYGEMSDALTKLEPIISLKINPNMPFSTVLSPDRRLIDFLFSESKEPDEAYSRFFSVLTGDDELDPFIANNGQFDAISISYDDGTRIFSIFGDEGSGRKFTIKHFAKKYEKSALAIDCAKLFGYDFGFVDKALWSATRECILTDGICTLTELSYREDTKEKFFGFMDLAFEKLLDADITVFTNSMEKIPMREITKLEYTQIELPTPDNRERDLLWKHYAVGYKFSEEVDLEEMATKFLFTPGKIKSALKTSKGLSAMAKEILISRKSLFEACYNQMSHELTQKATKIKATYTWDDIVMSKDQRQSLEYACDQMRFRKQVFEQWDYNRKYPYGRGLSVLLFGAPGTGKSMCAQVLANALNLELYRVDLSKVVDKYVGETEKSISMIFREAKKCNVVLFFDECDTLFAKRSDDGGSSQSSNNNKTALLLQEVEAYDGVSVLATNYKHNIDPAFFRRMKFIVEFQFPDPATRYILWKATIPKNTPLADDVDIKFLADKFEFVGGNIKNCILNAAFLAAGDPTAEGMVHMKHYLMAIRYEFVKTGKVFTRADFEPYADLVLNA